MKALLLLLLFPFLTYADSGVIKKCENNLTIDGITSYISLSVTTEYGGVQGIAHFDGDENSTEREVGFYGDYKINEYQIRKGLTGLELESETASTLNAGERAMSHFIMADTMAQTDTEMKPYFTFGFNLNEVARIRLYTSVQGGPEEGALAIIEAYGHKGKALGSFMSIQYYVSICK